MIIKPITPRIKIKLSRLTKPSSSRVRAFTLMESLLVLVTTASLIILLSGQIGPVFSQVRSQLFFLEFEHLYKESQQLSQVRGQDIYLTFSRGKISNGYDEIELPADVSGPADLQLAFDRSGGNHSLAQLDFQTADRQVSYQLYLGSGKYKKTEN